jgi:hypothetical protein
MKGIASKVAFVAVALVMSGAVAGAQTLTSVATVNVSATVTASLAATDGNNLSFPNVIQGGSASTILPSASGAGKVNIVGANNQGITITATSLPSTLAGPSSSTIGVGTYQYCYSQNNTNTACTPTAIVSAGAISGQALSGTGNAYLWIGATLAAPASNQTVGNYSANMTITVTAP